FMHVVIAKPLHTFARHALNLLGAPAYAGRGFNCHDRSQVLRPAKAGSAENALRWPREQSFQTVSARQHARSHQRLV
ncbi:MAG: hypothetical protein E5Y55_33525, partial [Mesorhizobium sp.]